MLPWTRKIHFSKITLIVFSIVVVFLFFGFTPHSVLAQSTTDTLGVSTVGKDIALSGSDIRVVAVKIINAILGLLGIIVLGLILYAGFIIMTSGGDETKVANGKKIMINAVIGLAIILSAFVIVKFISNKLLGATGFKTGDENTGNAPILQTFSGSGSLGTLIKDHYPLRDQKDVARNTSIVVTFAVPIDPASIAINSNNSCWNADATAPTTTCDFTKGDKPYYGDCIFDSNNKMLCDTLNTSTIKITTVANSTSTNSGLSASAFFSYENGSVYTIVLRPSVYLGSSTTTVDYLVNLLEGVKKENSTQSIFIGRSSKFYKWNFQTGTTLDLNPPFVTSISPDQNQTDTKDTIIKINFNEAIDPTTVQGILDSTGSFKNILVNNVSTTPTTVVTGTWKISNGYKTVEFIPSEACGQNSCGQTKYCLPVVCSVNDIYCTNGFSTLIRTATSTGNPDAPFEAVPFSGVYDLAFNGLDNLSDNPVTGFYSLHKPMVRDSKVIDIREKNPDNKFWDFNIQNKMDKKAPYITKILPDVDAEKVASGEDLSITFSKDLLYHSMNEISLIEYPAHVCADVALNTSTKACTVGTLDDIWYRISAKIVTSTTHNQTEISVQHRQFGPNGLDLYYFPMIPHTLQDSHQNCFYPGYGPNLKGLECIINYNNDGDIIGKSNCAPVTDTESDQDTACVYGNGQTVTSTINDCKIILEKNSRSTYKSN